MNHFKSKLYQLLLKPRSENEDRARREFILNVLLLGTLFLSSVSVVSYFVSRQRIIAENGTQNSIPVEILLGISLTFLSMYLFSRGGRSRLVAQIFVGLYFFAASYTVWFWGPGVPQALLIYALVIVMAGVLVSTLFSILMTFLSGLILLLVGHLSINQTIEVDISWQTEMFNYTDIIVTVATLTIIAITSWLFNREIDKALKRAKQSEAELLRERDQLEIKVEERTRELRRAEMEKIFHLYQLADFGRLSTSLFHDLINPLNVVSLNLDQLNTQAKAGNVTNDEEALIALKRAMNGTKKIERFVKTVRTQIKKQKHEHKRFDIIEEIQDVINLFEHKASQIRVKLSFEFSKPIDMVGNPVRLNQLISNHIANSLDAYEKHKGVKRLVKIKVTQPSKNNAKIVIEDYGPGMSNKVLSKVFEPYYTTKGDDQGTGIGMAISKRIVEKELNGSIVIESKEKKGTKVIIEFPFSNEL